MNIAQKMREVLPLLKKGVGGTPTPGLKPECEDSWNEQYAVVDGLWYTRGPFDDQEYFDHERFRRDYEHMVRSHFPECDVKLHWSSQEIEVSQGSDNPNDPTFYLRTR